ncbi:MAG: glycosyltransferase [Lachnospiraceae bacterium]|nr:glycosyltransferase [Lachnospiraceae bacterium]
MNNISVCIITKNEADNLRKCLKSIKPYGFEIVVVDTGSTDETKEVIDTYADISGNFTWCNDFSAARNYSLGLASNDAILILDSDEWIESCDVDGLRYFMQIHPEWVGRIERINDLADANSNKAHERISRFFDRRYYEYYGRIHEQVTRKTLTGDYVPMRAFEVRQRIEEDQKLPVVDIVNDTYENVAVVIGHSGFAGTKENRSTKALRNISLLKLDLDEYGVDPYVLYQLGKSYYMLNDYDKAAEYFERGLEFDLNPALEYVQDLIETYGYALLNGGRGRDMIFLTDPEVYNAFAVTADYVFLCGLAYMNSERFEEAIKEFEKATTMKITKIEGCNSYQAYYNAGVVCECLGDRKRALHYYDLAGSFAPALEGKKRIQ